MNIKLKKIGVIFGFVFATVFAIEQWVNFYAPKSYKTDYRIKINQKIEVLKVIRHDKILGRMYIDCVDFITREPVPRCIFGSALDEGEILDQLSLSSNIVDRVYYLNPLNLSKEYYRKSGWRPPANLLKLNSEADNYYLSTRIYKFVGTFL